MSTSRGTSISSSGSAVGHDAHGYDPSIDGIRGIAIILVLLFHIEERGLSGGFLGVDLFFGLSGFLITTLLLREWRTHGRIRLRLFYARRALRLMPAVLALFGVLWVVVFFARGLFATTPALMASTTLYTLGYSANWVMASHLGSWPRPLDHLWSLAIEEQFYLVWPVLLVMMLRARWSARRMLAFVCVAAALVAAWRAVLWWRTNDLSRVYFATDTRVDGLFLGCAMAIALHYGLVRRRALRWAGVVGAIAFVASMLVLPSTDASLYLGGFAIVNVAVALTLGALAISPSSRAKEALQFRPLVWLGRVSYGLYLWHLPVYYGIERAAGRVSFTNAWVVAAAQIVMALAVSAASYYVLELRALRLKRYFYPSPPSQAPAVAMVAPSAVDMESA